MSVPGACTEVFTLRFAFIPAANGRLGENLENTIRKVDLGW